MCYILCLITIPILFANIVSYWFSFSKSMTALNERILILSSFMSHFTRILFRFALLLLLLLCILFILFKALEANISKFYARKERNENKLNIVVHVHKDIEYCSFVIHCHKSIWLTLYVFIFTLALLYLMFLCICFVIHTNHLCRIRKAFSHMVVCTSGICY